MGDAGERDSEQVWAARGEPSNYCRARGHHRKPRLVRSSLCEAKDSLICRGSVWMGACLGLGVGISLGDDEYVLF